jgi:hypothetical protein
MTKNVPIVGIIAEDDNDVDSIKILIHRLAENNRIGIRRKIGHGCGKINRKCNAWSGELKTKGCSLLIIVHDLDENKVTLLKDEIIKALEPCAICDYLICIPIQEIEAWLLSDPEGIRAAMALYSTPNVKYPPETINSPKEHLGELIHRASKGERVYLNTKHNEIIAKQVSIDNIKRKCPSFLPFYSFIKSNFNN